jgi:hypothetical protein
VVIKLKAVWRDGTTHLMFEPLEFLGKLAALTPRPEINLLIYTRRARPACALAPTGRGLWAPRAHGGRR